MPNAMPHLQRTLRLNLRDTSLLTPRSVLRPNPSSQQTQHMRHLVSRAGPATTRTAQSSTSSSFRQFLSRYRQGVCTPSQLLRSLRQRRPFSSTRARYEQAVPTAEPTSLSARLKKLSREYGWSAFGVYMALSALDFPFCFLAVRWLGTERIGRWEHAVISWFKKAIPINWPGNEGKTDIDAVDGVVEVVGEGIDKGLEKVDGQITGWDHGVRDAQKDNSGETATIWTQLALAYAIHKSFIFVRVPMTAAVTPKVVKTLRGWGWNIGKRTPKAEREARKAAKAIDKAAKGS